LRRTVRTFFARKLSTAKAITNAISQFLLPLGAALEAHVSFRVEAGNFNPNPT
jgi:hypothetical protein